MLADPTRAAIVLSLMDGRSRVAKKLALDAGVTPQTASAHLRKLVAAHILACEARGRFKHFRIAGAEVAHAVEALSELGAVPGRTLPPAAHELRFARCCYDHLAGRLGVAITERLPLLGGGVLAELGIDLDALEASRRPLSRCCVDWTERRISWPSFGSRWTTPCVETDRDTCSATLLNLLYFVKSTLVCVSFRTSARVSCVNSS